jgi:hypothetical protein
VAAGANQDRTVQRQSFGSKSIYGGASSNWLSTTSTVATLGVAPGGFVSSAEPAITMAKAASPARAFIVTPMPVVGIERLPHGPRSLYEAFHTPSAARLRPSYRLSLRHVVFGAVPSQIPAMSAHRFRVGQTVVVPWSGPEGAIPLGPYVIVRLLPLQEGEPQYRVKSSADGHQRALLERQMKALEERPQVTAEAPLVERRRRRK